MSAAFTFHEFDCWGTNGTIEAYLERLCQLAADDPDTDRTLMEWLTLQRDAFFLGKVIRLEEALHTPGLIKQFIHLFDCATAEFLAGEQFTDYGKQWLRSEPSKLHTRLLKAVA